MIRTWQVHRDAIVHPDGQRRWDRAYQLLLSWADEHSVAQAPADDQEDDDAHCFVCPRLDQSPTPDPHD
ncbi:MAG: hypothetical protein M3R24_14630 [Chloroflexota bacterium]|nr:hypothetical protein [Chloroflexota bacterium]